MDEEERNYMCLVLLLNRVGFEKLRQFFINEWNSLGGFEPWTDSPKNGVDVLTKFTPLHHEKSIIESGDTTKWSISILIRVLIYSKPPFVYPVNKLLVDSLRVLRDIRNQVSHTAAGKIESTEFHRLYRDACSALSLFGALKEDFRQVEEDVQRSRNKVLPLLKSVLAHDLDVSQGLSHFGLDPPPYDTVVSKEKPVTLKDLDGISITMNKRFDSLEMKMEKMERVLQSSSTSDIKIVQHVHEHKEVEIEKPSLTERDCSIDAVEQRAFEWERYDRESKEAKETVWTQRNEITEGVSTKQSEKTEGVFTKQTITEKRERIFETAAKEAEAFNETFKRCVDKRRETVIQLRDLIDTLKDMSKEDDTAILVGAAKQSEMSEDTALTEKMKKVQSNFNKDKEMMARIDDVHANITVHSENITQSKPDHGSKDQILCSLLVANAFSKLMTKTDSVESTIDVFTMVCTGSLKPPKHKKAQDKPEGEESMATEIALRLAEEMKEVFSKGVVRASEITVEGVIDVDTPSAFDIYEILDASKTLSGKVSTAEAAKTLQDIEQGFSEELGKMEKLIADIASLAVELGVFLKDTLTNLLETISCNNEITDEQIDELKKSLNLAGDKTWKRAVSQYGIRSWLALAHVYRFLKPKLKAYQTANDTPGEHVVDLTFLAHGGVSNPLVPCRLHYLNDDLLEPIILYVPWGCMLDASAAYGIATGRINPEIVAFRNLLDEDQRLNEWNSIPKTWTLIPNVLFTRVSFQQTPMQSLRQIDDAFKQNARGIFVPFFPELTELTMIPLCDLCIGVALNAWDLNFDRAIKRQCDPSIPNQVWKCRIHIASCLNPLNDDILVRSNNPNDVWPRVNCSQYWSIPISNRPAFMTLRIDNVSAGLQSAFNNLNQYFST